MDRKIYVLQINSDVLYCLSNATVAYTYLKKAVSLYEKLELPSYATFKRELDANNLYEHFYQHTGSDQAVRIKINLFLLRTKPEAPKKQFSLFKPNHRIKHESK